MPSIFRKYSYLYYSFFWKCTWQNGYTTSIRWQINYAGKHLLHYYHTKSHQNMSMFYSDISLQYYYIVTHKENFTNLLLPLLSLCFVFLFEPWMDFATFGPIWKTSKQKCRPTYQHFYCFSLFCLQHFCCEIFFQSGMFVLICENNQSIPLI